jgi:MFS family permease
MPNISEKLHVFSALRSRGFRLYWFGHLSAVSGHQIVILAQGWLIWELTESEFLLGALGLVAAVPAVLLTLFGGAVADKVELRRLLMALQFISGVALFVLATLVVTGRIQVWHLFALAFLFGIIQAFDHPARQALFPHLLDRSHLMNAVSLNSMIWPGTRIFGPALAGVVIDRVGVLTGAPLMGAGAAFYMAFAAFMVFGLLLLPVKVPPIERAKGGNVLKNIMGGLSFIWGQKLFRSLVAMNYLDIFLLASHITLLPVFAGAIFQGDASTLGSLYVVSGLGSLSGALVAANLGYFSKRGWLIIGGATVQALFLAVFALSGSYHLALWILPLSGIGLSLFMVATQTTVQTLVDDEFRGRVMAIWGMNYSVVYPLGQLQMGTVAGLSRTNLSGVLGGLAGAPFAVILGSALMLAYLVFSVGSNRQFRDLSPEGPPAA